MIRFSSTKELCAGRARSILLDCANPTICYNATQVSITKVRKWGDSLYFLALGNFVVRNGVLIIDVFYHIRSQVL